jgi:aldehyde:ferredoxin oxidoreductase
MLKYAGYDHMVITGRADKPVYLKIDDDNVEICDAAHLWGRDTFDSTDALWDELGNEFWISVIGPAGEKMVRYAMILNNKHSAFSRTGLGAVMGSKNLKAIVARGTKGIEVANGKEFMELAKMSQDKVASFPLLNEWRTIGFFMALEPYTSMGYMLGKNGTESAEDIMERFPIKEYLARVRSGITSCPGCSLGCKGKLKMKGGKYDGLRFRMSTPAVAVGAFGGQVAVDGFDEVIKCTELTNRYGMDMNSLTATIGFAIELYKKGIITDEDTGGLELDWGTETVRTLIDRIAVRDGFGRLLGEGVVKAAEEIGKGAEYYAVHIKGMDLGLGLRGRLSTENFGQATNPRGAHLERSPSISFMPGRKRESYVKYCQGIGVPEDKIDAVCTGPENFNVARLTRWVEDYNSILFSLGLCHRTPISQHYNLEIFARLYSAATGLDMKPEEIRQAGERIWNMSRLFNMREGKTKQDDIFPERLMKESVKLRKKEIPAADPEMVKKLLQEYYEERGWEPDTGNPGRPKLDELGLEL